MTVMFWFYHTHTQLYKLCPFNENLPIVVFMSINSFRTSNEWLRNDRKLVDYT